MEGLPSQGSIGWEGSNFLDKDVVSFGPADGFRQFGEIHISPWYGKARLYGKVATEDVGVNFILIDTVNQFR
jgi:hypothetical protein